MDWIEIYPREERPVICVSNGIVSEDALMAVTVGDDSTVAALFCIFDDCGNHTVVTALSTSNSLSSPRVTS